MLILVPVTVYDVPVEYSICLIVSTTSVRLFVSEVIVPLVKLGVTGAAKQGDMSPAASSKAGVVCFT